MFKKEKCVFIFGRFSPVHLGHKLLFDKGISIANTEKCTFKLFLSTTYDCIRNPVHYDDKCKSIKTFFPEVYPYICKSTNNNLFDICTSLSTEYENIDIIVGSDRENDFKKNLEKYNKVLYDFKSINVIKVGVDRNCSEYSSTLMRNYVSTQNFEKFKSLLPGDDNDKKEFYDLILRNMRIKK